MVRENSKMVKENEQKWSRLFDGYFTYKILAFLGNQGIMKRREEHWGRVCLRTGLIKSFVKHKIETDAPINFLRSVPI